MIGVPAAADIGFLLGALSYYGDLGPVAVERKVIVDVDPAPALGEVDVILWREVLVAKYGNAMFVDRLPDRLDLPDDAPAQTAWAPGFYAVTVEAGPAGRPPRSSNSLPLALSPRVTSVTFAAPNVTVVARPQIRPDQRARLLLGEAELPAAPHPAATDTLTFDASSVPAADYVARLRIDGVDSLPAVLSAAGLAFDPAQRVTIP